ncbi:diguanylate cyclase (GGDEF) domain-containing protein [Brevundimonas sp. 374]|nr:diguanylate cyclase (GGDEF) domain-containing protein [Brevundimonas sp. 374]
MSADHALPSFDRATQTESRLRSHSCAVTDVAEHDLTAEIARLRVELEAWKTRAAAAEAAADHDVLTPALNRRGFITAMQRTMAYCQRHGVPAVLLYLDMDGFKSVNDSLGHAAGDAALVAVAELFLANLRESDAVGRLGGDEFALLMLHAGYEEGRAKARQLAEALKTEGFVWDGQKTELGGSFGVRAWDGHTDAEVWLTEADAAMWVRKKGR